MSVTWISGNSGASGSFGSGGAASGAVVVAGTAFGGHHPNLPLSFCRWGNSVPIHTFRPLVLLLNWWLVVPGPGGLFYGGFGRVAVAVLLILGGISQSFLNSKRFSDIFPILGYEVLVQTGMFSRDGGCSLKYLLVKVFDFPNWLGL